LPRGDDLAHLAAGARRVIAAASQVLETEGTLAAACLLGERLGHPKRRQTFEHVPDAFVEREVMLLRVTANSDRRGEILDAAGIFTAKAVDVGVNTITFELSGPPSKLADFLELMRPYGIADLVKSGRIALIKDAKTRNGQSGLRSA
ncbi:MAG: acetolactate synthase small subunit, partial [Acidimicrobiia bacterium]